MDGMLFMRAWMEFSSPVAGTLDLSFLLASPIPASMMWIWRVIPLN
jgi:hypothetical protein